MIKAHFFNHEINHMIFKHTVCTLSSHLDNIYICFKPSIYCFYMSATTLGKSDLQQKTEIKSVLQVQKNHCNYKEKV